MSLIGTDDTHQKFSQLLADKRKALPVAFRMNEFNNSPDGSTPAEQSEGFQSPFNLVQSESTSNLYNDQ
jgi:hypothetical protein